jgi:hypothetical protein
MKKVTPKSKKPNGQTVKMLIQLHIAEYNMLTLRHTYFMTLQYGLISVFMIFLTLIASVWDKYDHIILIWVGFSMAQLFAVILTTNIFEINNIILYIERDLKKLICFNINENIQSIPSITRADFLKYEQYQTISRSSFLSRYLECILMAFIIIVFLLIILFTCSFKYEIWVIFFNLILSVLASINTLKILKLRNEFSKIISEI